MTVATESSVMLEDAPEDEPPHPMEVALGLAGLFDSPRRNGHFKKRCVCGRAECATKCSAVTLTHMHVDHSVDHLVALGDMGFAWKAAIATLRAIPTEYGWLLSAPGQPHLAIELT